MNRRPATPADAQFLRQLHHRAYRGVVLQQFGSWDEAAQDGWFEKGLTEANFEVVEENGERVGAVASKEASDRLFLVELQVLPECQGRGLGSALLKQQLERARLLQKPLALRVLFANRARALYERHGFVVTGQTETHYLMERPPTHSG